MTKKYFKEAARIIRIIKDDNLRHIVANEFATMFHANNQNFNYNKFFDACDVRR